MSDVTISPKPQEPLRAFDEMHYHKVTSNDALITMEAVRYEYIKLARTLDVNLPECRSKSLAITQLEDSLMRAIQAIAVTNGERQQPRGENASYQE